MIKRIKPVFGIIHQAFKASGWRAWMTMALFAVNGLGAPVFAWLLGKAVNGLSHGATTSEMMTIAAGIAFFASASMIISELAWRFGQRVQEETAHQLDRDILDMVMSVPSVDHHERPEYLDKIEQSRRERFMLSMAITVVFLIVSMLVQLVATISVLATTDWRLFALVLFAIPQIWASGKAERRRVANMERLQVEWRRSDNVVSLVTEPSSAKEVRVFGLSDELLARHSESSRKSYEQEFGDRLWGAWRISAGNVIFAIAFIVAIGMVGQRVVNGGAPIGALITAVTLCGGLMAQAAMVTHQVGWFNWTLTALDRLEWLKQYAQSHKVYDPREVAPVVRDKISFDNVTFAYPGNAERVILKNVSFDMPAGSTVAIIGDNGAGKSTIVKLLTGMYQPTSGAIRVDGNVLEPGDVEDWREHLSAAYQDHVRFETTAGMTVGLGDRTRLADELRIIDATERGGARSVVDQLPEQLDTQLGATWAGGADLSGGQWQKLALARAMMRDPVALILDEPTSALDAETEHALFERFSDAASEQRQRGMITVVVSHRFSTVRMADLIVVISGGEVVEKGSHGQLMAQDGLYAELYNLQARAYR